MGNFAKVLAENQSININRISTEFRKYLNGFNENLSAYKANRSSRVATVSINSNKRSKKAATISVNSARHTSRTNARGEEDRNSYSGQLGWNCIRKAKQKCLSSKCQKSKIHNRETGECCQLWEQDELSLHGGSDYNDQVKRLADTPWIAIAKGGSNEEGEESDEDDLINLMEQTGEPIGSNLARTINNVICTPIKKNLIESWKTTPKSEEIVKSEEIQHINLQWNTSL